MEDSNSFDDDLEPFIYLKQLDEYKFCYAYEISSIFNNNKGIITIIGDDEIINLKVYVQHKDHDDPLKFKAPLRIKNVEGRKVVASKYLTFLHGRRDGSLFKFKSSQTLDLLEYVNIIYFRCFNFKDDNCCFLMIALEDSKIVLLLFDSTFDGYYTFSRKSIDLLLPEDQIKTIENELSMSSISQDFTFESEMIINASEEFSTVEFLNAFLNCDIENEGIKDVLLLSINDRLLFLKYRGHFNDENSQEETSIVPILISRGKIKGIKFINDAVMIIDDFWMLTIYYQCLLTRIIKKKEIPLIGEVSCFRFTNDHLIYSNRDKIVFMKFSLPSSEPQTFEISLSMIATFTVVENYKFVFAIDRNKFSYFIPMRPPMFIHDKHKPPSDEYVDITNSDFLKFPQTVKYLEGVEKDFKELTDQIIYEKNLSMFLDQLAEMKNFVAGSAEIEFLPYLPKVSEDDIVCKPTNQKSGYSYMKVSLKLESILKSFNFTISFYRHKSQRGTLVRNIDYKERNKTEFSIFVPCELNDDHPDNCMELFVHFNFNSNDEKHVLQFPIKLTEVKVNELYKPIVNTEIDECVKALKDLMKKNNV